MTTVMYTAEEVKEHREALYLTLEGDEYPQSCGSLRDQNGFCCLGVACDVYRKGTRNGEWRFKSGCYFFNLLGDYQHIIVLPAEVRDYYGFGHTDPVVNRHHVEQVTKGFSLDERQESQLLNISLNCSVFNDTMRFSFKQIAALLRAQYPSK